MREERLAGFFKTLSDPTRMRMLYALMNAELCVNELAEALGMNQSAVSHQLRILRDSRMITARRRGQQMLYSLADAQIKTVLQEGERYLARGTV